MLNENFTTTTWVSKSPLRSSPRFAPPVTTRTERAYRHFGFAGLKKDLSAEASPSSSRPKTFHPFPRLPLELQHEILRHTLPERYISALYIQPYKSTDPRLQSNFFLLDLGSSPLPPTPLFHVSRVTRAFAISFYGDPASGAALFSPVFDTLRLEHVAMWGADLAGEDGTGLHIAMAHDIDYPQTISLKPLITGPSTLRSSRGARRSSRGTRRPPRALRRSPRVATASTSSPTLPTVFHAEPKGYMAITTPALDARIQNIVISLGKDSLRDRLDISGADWTKRIESWTRSLTGLKSAGAVVTMWPRGPQHDKDVKETEKHGLAFVRAMKAKGKWTGLERMELVMEY